MHYQADKNKQTILSSYICTHSKCFCLQSVFSEVLSLHATDLSFLNIQAFLFVRQVEESYRAATMLEQEPEGSGARCSSRTPKVNQVKKELLPPLNGIILKSYFCFVRKWCS